MASTSSSTAAVAATKSQKSTSQSLIHKCPYNKCEKSFSKKYNLKAHLRLHTNEMPFVCQRPGCDKKFKWRSSLSSHTIWHDRQDSGEGKSEKGGKNNASKKKKSQGEKEESKRDTSQETGKRKRNETPQKRKRPRTGGGGGGNVVCQATAMQTRYANTNTRTESAKTEVALRAVTILPKVEPKVESKNELKNEPRIEPRIEPKIGPHAEQEGPEQEDVNKSDTAETKVLDETKSMSPMSISSLSTDAKPVLSSDMRIDAMFDTFTLTEIPTSDLTDVPGSPVTSDRGSDIDETSITSLSFLDNMANDNNDLLIEDPMTNNNPFGKVEGLLTPQLLAQFASPGCADISRIDDSFSDAELESLQSFYLTEAM